MKHSNIVGVLALIVLLGAGCAQPAVQPERSPEVPSAPELTSEQLAMIVDMEGKGLDQDCPEQPATPSTQKYELIEQCLYRDNTRVFQKSLPYMMVYGDFGPKGIELIYFPMYADHALGSVQTWFWFTQDQKTYFYLLAGGRSCQGCEMPGGPRIVIDETTGEPTDVGVVEDMPRPSTLERSPDYTRAAYIQHDETGERIALYSFATEEVGPVIYEVPEGQTIVRGCYHDVSPCSYEVSWKDDSTIELTPFVTDENGDRVEEGVDENGTILYVHAEPILISLP